MDIALEKTSPFQAETVNPLAESQLVKTGTDPDVTQVLQEWSAANKDATAELFLLPYKQTACQAFSMTPSETLNQKREELALGPFWFRANFRTRLPRRVVKAPRPAGSAK
jgi:hypothetical protein